MPSGFIYLFMRKIVLFFTIALLLNSCNNDVGNSFKRIPLSYGSVNQVLVVSDKTLWEGPVGDTIRYYYSSFYPLLPQPEPVFDLKFFSAEELLENPLRKELNKYLIVADLSDKDSPATKLVSAEVGEENVQRSLSDTTYSSAILRDRWATGQVIIFQFASSQEQLIEKLKKNFPAAKRVYNQADKPAVDAAVYVKGQSQKLMETLRSSMGVQMKIPSDYYLAVNDGNVFWVRKEDSFLSSNIMVHKIPYRDQQQLTKGYLKSVRDTLGKYVSTSEPGSFMQVNDIDLPLLTYKANFGGNYALEARGIWEINNDYMAGPFLSYLILAPNSKELYFIDGFIHAPAKDKREYMQHLEHIFSTISF